MRTATPGSHQERTFILYTNAVMVTELVEAVWPRLRGQVQVIQLLTPQGYLAPEIAPRIHRVEQMHERRMDLVLAIADREGHFLFLLALEAQATPMEPERLNDYYKLATTLVITSPRLQDRDGNSLPVVFVIFYTGPNKQPDSLYRPLPDITDPARKAAVPLIAVRSDQYQEHVYAIRTFHAAFIALERARYAMEEQDLPATQRQQRLIALFAAMAGLWSPAQKKYPPEDILDLQEALWAYLALAFQDLYPDWYNLYVNALMEQGLLPAGEGSMMTVTEVLKQWADNQYLAGKQEGRQEGQQEGRQEGQQEGRAEAARHYVMATVSRLWDAQTAARWQERAAAYPPHAVLAHFPSLDQLFAAHARGEDPLDLLPVYREADALPPDSDSGTVLNLPNGNGIPG